jgi:signal recognition particle subunit SEC65
LEEKQMKNDTFNCGSLTLKLLKTIGSPFAPKQEVIDTKEEALELYNYAMKNKIGLFYLETLNKQNRLSDFGLSSEYEDALRKYREQLLTAVRASELLNSIGCDYAVFKSIMPFPCIVNDVDVIFFGESSEFNKVVTKFLSSGYEKVKSPIGFTYPFKIDLHDSRKCKHENPDKKDVYDLDLYRGTTVSYIAYLNEAKFRKYVTETKILDGKVKILKPEADLVYLIIHSIFTEQLLPLSLYYATIYYLPKISIDNLISIARENNVTYPMRAYFSLIANLHMFCHGSIPKKLEKVLTELGYETKERSRLVKNDFKMPHKYSWQVLNRAFLEKAREKKFRLSMVRQVASMLNPRLTQWVIYNIIGRRRRETY